MLIVTSQQMRNLDKETIEGLGIPGLILMENAGRGVAEAIVTHYLPDAQRGVTILAGPGNNGGDGFVVARHLFQKGIHVKLAVLAPEEKFKGDALVNYKAASALGLSFAHIMNEEAVSCLQGLFSCSGLIVDAIFGTGLAREVTGRFAKVIETANASGLPIVSVDIPSGLCSDTGQPLGACIKAHLTVTMALAKIGHVTMPGARYTGKLQVVDIGIPEFLVDRAGIKTELFGLDQLRDLIVPRLPDGHKGTFGHLVVLSGSRGKTGACTMVAHGALRSGAGLVTVGCPKSCQGLIATKLTEAMTFGLSETKEATLSKDSIPEIEELCKGKRAACLGPGVGLVDETLDVMRQLSATLSIPMVLDADALTAIGTQHSLLKDCPSARILTPHPGEAARLLGCSTKEIQADRVASAMKISESTGQVVVLKGARTVVASPEGRISINSSGNPGMGTGGMGDVLTGIIGGLLAQGYDPWNAARIGVFVHGYAADQLANIKGPYGYLASEVADWLPRIWAAHQLGNR